MCTWTKSATFACAAVLLLSAGIAGVYLNSLDKLKAYLETICFSAAASLHFLMQNPFDCFISLFDVKCITKLLK